MAWLPVSLQSLEALCEAALGGLPLPGGPGCGSLEGAARLLLLGLELGISDNPLKSGMLELWVPESGSPGSPGPSPVSRADAALLSMSAVRGLCAELHGGPRGPGHPGPDSNWEPQLLGACSTDSGSRTKGCHAAGVQGGYHAVLGELLGDAETLACLLDTLLGSPERLLSHGAGQVATALCLLLEKVEVTGCEMAAWTSAWASACVSRLKEALSETQLGIPGQAEAAWALSDLVRALAREETFSGRTSEGLTLILCRLDPMWSTVMDRVFTHARKTPSPPPLLLLALLELQDALVRSGRPGYTTRFPFSCDGVRCLLGFLSQPGAPYSVVRRLAGQLKCWLVRNVDVARIAHPSRVHHCAEGAACLARAVVAAVRSGWLRRIYVRRVAYHLGGPAGPSAPYCEESSHALRVERVEPVCVGTSRIVHDWPVGSSSPQLDCPAVDLVTLRGVVLSVLVSAVVCAENMDSAGVRGCVEAAACFVLGFLDGPATLATLVTPSPLTSHPCLWVVTLFGDQDNDLVEAAISLLLLRSHLDLDAADSGDTVPWSERTGVNATCAFVSVVRHACCSPAVLLDLLISSETRFLRLLVLALRHVRASPRALARACLAADLHGHTGTATLTTVHRHRHVWRTLPRGEECSDRRRRWRQRQNGTTEQVVPVVEEVGRKKQRRLVEYDESSEDDADVGSGDRLNGPESGRQWTSVPELPSSSLPFRDDGRDRVIEVNDESNKDHCLNSDANGGGDDSDNDVCSHDNERCDAEGGNEGGNVSDLDDDDLGSGVMVPTLLSVLRCLAGLQLRVQRLCQRNLFPYDARPLLRLLNQAQAACTGLDGIAKTTVAQPTPGLPLAQV